MSLPENKTIRLAVIPWIVAIIALVGLNALASVHRFTKKLESSHESAISELSDETQPGERSAEPLVLEEPVIAEEIIPSVGYTLVPQIIPRSVLTVTGFKAGKAQGRAPPEQGRA